MNPHLLEFVLLELHEDEFEDDDREVDAEPDSNLSDFVISCGTVFEFDSASDSDFGLREVDSLVFSLQSIRGVRFGDTERVRRWIGA